MSDDTRLALLEQNIGHISQTLVRIEKMFDKIDNRLDTLEERQISNFKWIMGTTITLFSGLYATFIAGIVAKMCNWV